ncbi:hypothetical protein GGTG_07644 [Gaeumannomyces tritici R3-111a-1]|uniref:Uncharacterized protein n=1 Tax=Gaeumannomyces tritici (strain R3-111a-1) TaxID=644352 RepID=J3P296_GAET3|nr:hypothetical protein GGTG_07644 [Gaeumannomyces tritici R3-111a-1]EJT73788.1 hypothetical protein GGTG_07644 [Gaeumannomyces tritici R3-111a-1]
MAISAVLLGLTPTILQSLACSTLDLAFLSLRRPVLALMLAVGSPIVSPTRAMAFQRGVEEVVAKGAAAAAAPPNAPHHHPRPLPRGWWLVALAQYAAAGGCVANMANLSYELGVHAMTVISPRFTHQVALWGALVALVHVGASVGLRLRVRVEGRAPPDRDAGLPRALAALPGWMRDEVVPSAYNSTMSFSNLHDGLWFSLLSWAASAANVAITLYSTVVLSGLLFFSIRDSLTIVARYMVSVIVCRAVFALERIGAQALIQPSSAICSIPTSTSRGGGTIVVVSYTQPSSYRTKLASRHQDTRQQAPPLLLLAAALPIKNMIAGLIKAAEVGAGAG